MNTLKKASNEEKMEFLLLVLNENKQLDKNSQPLFYSIKLVRFGAQIAVVYREPASTNIKEQIIKFSSPEKFNPDYIVVDIFTGKSRNVRKPVATYKFDYKSKSS